MQSDLIDFSLMVGGEKDKGEAQGNDYQDCWR